MISALRTLSVVTLVVVFTACGGGSSEDRSAKANEFLAASDDDSAIIELKNALQQESDSAEARWLLGKVYLESALELNPEFQQADILLVMNHVQKQDYEAAIEAAQAYRRRNLTSTTPLNLLGRVYQAAGQRVIRESVGV